MASIHLQGILVDSVGEIDVGGVITFTHLTTTGETIASTQTELVIPPDGAYSIDVEYGQIRIDYTTRNTERFVANVIVNSASTATSLPELLSATTPVAKPIIIQMQGLVADATAAATTAEAFADQLTTTELIASSAVFAPNTNITTKGYTTSGDGGAGSWVQNGVTGQTVSQSPAQLGNALLNDASGNQWALVKHSKINVKELGAVGDLATDDTLSLVAAINSAGVEGAGCVYLPKGKYKVTSSIACSPSYDIALTGDGTGISQIRSTVAGAPTLLAGDHVGTSPRTFSLRDLSMQYDGASPPIAGTVAIHAKNLVSPSKFSSFSIQKFYDGLKLEATSLIGNIFVSDFVVGNTESKGVHLLGGVQGVWLTEGKITARQDGGPVSGSVGIQMDYCNGIYMKSLDCLLNDRGMLVSPSAGETVHWVFGSQVILDTNAGAGLDINPQGGTVNGFDLSNSWSSSNGDIGVKIRGSSASVVDGISLNMRILKNGLQGIRLLGGPTTFTNIKIDGCSVLSNNQTMAGVSGVQVDGGISGFTIQNCTVGTSSLFANNQTNGIRVFAGTSDNYIITGNNLVGNVSTGLNDGGTGANKVIDNNIS